MGAIGDNLQAVRQRIALAAGGAGRDVGSVALLAVSKTFGVQAVRTAWAAGQRAFGESYVQEALDKMSLLEDLSIEWHYIGPLQSNKSRVVAERFDWVHSISSLKTAQRLSLQRPADRAPLSVCLQVNVDAEASKAGVAESELMALALAVAALPRLRLRGLMCIPAPATGIEAQRAAFAKLRAMQQRLIAEGLALDTLSMGMSDDLEAAILEGSTWVRVGTAIFGVRPGAPIDLALA
ncbi:MAG: YggS family pyridoxal phosphate-dependent enzyme [Proteobacteria bacterium]|nr:YggS family pyridoxal phosphate-dependent enzyme [Burkholderiales bacterium]